MRALRPLNPKTGHNRFSVATDDDDEVPTATDDDNYIDFDLPSLDSDAARQVEHPAWPWVCLSADGDGVAVDYTGLSVG